MGGAAGQCYGETGIRGQVQSPRCGVITEVGVPRDCAGWGTQTSVGSTSESSALQEASPAGFLAPGTVVQGARNVLTYCSYMACELRMVFLHF